METKDVDDKVTVSRSVSSDLFDGALAIVNCPRCGQLCKERTPTEANARPLRRSNLANGGMCINCAFSDFLRQINTFEYAPIEAMRVPHIQEQFARVFKVGNSEADISEIDFETVIANWDLPFLKKPRKSKR